MFTCKKFLEQHMHASSMGLCVTSWRCSHSCRLHHWVQQLVTTGTTMLVAIGRVAMKNNRATRHFLLITCAQGTIGGTIGHFETKIQ